MRPHLLSLLAAGSLAVVAGCADTAAPTVSRPRDLTLNASVTSVNEAPPEPWARIIEGATGPGSVYAIYVPPADKWNGEAVFYAHGIRDAAEPVDLPRADGIAGLRDELGRMGYAVAYSSFSENGWAVKDGAQRTHQLRGLFASQVGQPSRSYLMGHSMGGLIAQQLAEKFPDQYQGTLAMCAPLGGGLAEVNYIANVRVVFDHFYPYAEPDNGTGLPGTVLDVPDWLTVPQVIARVQKSVAANPAGLLAIASLAQTPLAGNNGTELFMSLATALAYNVRGIDDFLGRTHGHSMFDNSGTTYAAGARVLLPPSFLATLLPGLNANVDRFTATPDALNYLDKYFTPSGALTVPTVTLHTTRDPVVPIFHERLFWEAVDRAGANGLLVEQRTVDRFGHCTFTTSEMMDAFVALRNRVVPPAN